MTVIANTDMVSNVLGRWSPSDLAYVEAFSVQQDSKTKYSNLAMKSLFQRKDTCKAWPSENSPFFLVELLFYNVKNLNLHEFGQIPVQIAGFDIIEISDRQWENINFFIEDYENGKIEFYCDGIEIISIDYINSINT